MLNYLNNLGFSLYPYRLKYNYTNLIMDIYDYIIIMLIIVYLFAIFYMTIYKCIQIYKI